MRPTWERNQKMLQLEQVTSCYEEGVDVLREISLEVNPNVITCILGSNGAGKTTLIKTIVHLVRPRLGKILFEGNRIDQLKTYEVIRLGISVVPEGRRLFPKLTVRDNLRIGTYSENDSAIIQGKMEEIFNVFPILKERIDQLSGTLSGGEQGMLAIARALIGKPKLLLLDEPSLGLAPILVKEFFRVIQRINENGMTILLIEQNARKALSIASRGYVLQKGRIVAEGMTDQLRQTEVIRSAYLRA